MKTFLPLLGGCGCGAVRYAATAEPYMVTACHCTTCQTRTDSAFSMTMLMDKAAFSITQGQTITRALPTGSGSTNVHHFCEACLVRTHSEPVAHPDLVFMRPGNLDDPSRIKPIAQIWTRSAHEWALADDIECFEQNPAEFTGAGAGVAGAILVADVQAGGE